MTTKQKQKPTEFIHYHVYTDGSIRVAPIGTRFREFIMIIQGVVNRRATSWIPQNDRNITNNEKLSSVTYNSTYLLNNEEWGEVQSRLDGYAQSIGFLLIYRSIRSKGKHPQAHTSIVTQNFSSLIKIN